MVKATEYESQSCLSFSVYQSVNFVLNRSSNSSLLLLHISLWMSVCRSWNNFWESFLFMAWCERCFDAQAFNISTYGVQLLQWNSLSSRGFNIAHMCCSFFCHFCSYAIINLVKQATISNTVNTNWSRYAFKTFVSYQ